MATINGNEPVDLASLEPKLAGKPPAPPENPDPLEKPAVAAKPPAPQEKPAPKEEKPPQEAAQPGPPQADIQARLNDPIAKFDMPGVPLGQAVGDLAAMSTLPVAFDPDALQELGVTLHDPVTIKLADTTVGKALEAIAASCKLACVAETGQVLITSPPEHRESLRRVRYTVSDLTGEDAKAVAELASLAQKLVVPDSWKANGGRGTIEVEPGALIVTQTGNVHYQVLVFCEKLRTARGKTIRSRLSPALFALATRVDRARDMLGRAVTLNFSQGAPLAEILAYLKTATGIEILVDRSALTAAGTSDDVKATFKVDQQPLRAALFQLLDPLGLSCRVIDAHTVQVTTRKAAAARFELEFYQAGESDQEGRDQRGPYPTHQEPSGHGHLERGRRAGRGLLRPAFAVSHCAAIPAGTDRRGNAAGRAVAIRSRLGSRSSPSLFGIGPG